ncbi:MAG: site-2 protease family protein [Phycisphaerae bacterium]|nr:site-2 protease family protein [Phycisphaerae bacterium]
MLIELLQQNPVLFVLLVPVLLLSLTLHEFAHARIALAFGDPTALRAGRVSLNPLRHLDPIGTIMLLVAGFGWAKPVPVNPYNLHPRRIGDIMVSLAGPLSNLSLAILAGCGLRVFIASPLMETLGERGILVIEALLIILSINVCLFTFNLLPLFPLDGHHILREMLPPEKQMGFMQWQMKYGMWTLLLLLAGPGLFSRFFHQPMPDPLGWLLSEVMHITQRAVGLA